MKQCSKCGLDKEEREFYIKSNGNLRSWCKQCSKAAWIASRKPYTPIPPELKKTRKTRQGQTPAACRTIKKHHDELKEDPERLSTEFLINICKANCRRLKK